MFTRGNSGENLSISERRCEQIVNLIDCKKEFFRRCLALNLQQSTLEQYDKVLKRFSSFCGTQGIEDIADITTGTLRVHIAGLSATMKPTSIKIHHMTLRVFFRFLLRDGIITNNPMERVEVPKVPKREIQAFSKKDISTLLNSFDKNEFLGFRNYTIMCMLFATGMRRSELTRLCISDIYFDIDLIKVIGKGDNQRNIPLPQTLRKVIIKYLTMRREYVDKLCLTTCPYFIISNKGERLVATTISDIFAKVAKEEGMKGVRVSPHTFRHTFAKMFLLNGGDAFTLQKLLGHSDIATTKKYINLNDKDLKVQNDKFNPFENVNWKYY
jgi:Site-specific recombinase XerD